MASDYESQTSSGGQSSTSDIDYTNVEAGLVFSSWQDGRKLSSGAIQVGRTELEDLDAIELTSGGRFYLPLDGLVRPFVGLEGTTFFTDDVAGFDVGDGFGLRLGGGIEIPLGETDVYIDLRVDYLVPLIEAESNTFPTIDTELEGLALRLGIGIDF